MRFLFLAVAVALCGCAPSAEAVQTAIAQTEAAEATATPLPSTPTRTPTTRPAAGNTYILEVGVCSSGSTISGDPKTQGCQLVLQKTVSLAKNQAAEASLSASIPGTYAYCALFRPDHSLVDVYVNPTSGSTSAQCSPGTGSVAKPGATPTRGPTSTPKPTTTPAPTATALKPLQVARKDFVTYPEKYTGQYVVVPGIVFNVISNTELQIYFGGDRESPLFVNAAKPFDNIYEDDDVVVYGIGADTHCGSNAFGGTICQPLIKQACITPHVYTSANVKKDKSGERPTPDLTLSTCE
jgi:hypothetical protein